MDTSKILMIICCFVLVICLTLCITTLTVLRNAIDENEQAQQDAAELVSNLNGCMAEWNEVISKEDSVEASAGIEKNELVSEGFCLREINGNIGVYTTDGYLIKLLDVSVQALPQADRKALSEGIQVRSWKELLTLIEDYTA